MKRRLKILVPLAVLVAVGLAARHFLGPGAAGNRVLLSGNVEVTQVDLSFQVPGRLVERAVDEGDRVKAGDLVGRLDPVDHELQENKAAADLEYARAVLAELVAGSRPEDIARAAERVAQARSALADLEKGSRSQEIAGAAADLERARAGQKAAQSRMELARADFDRYSAVHAQEGISRQAFEAHRTQLDTARAAVEEAAAQVRAAEERLSLFTEGPRREKILGARAALDQARAEYDLVKAGPRKETLDQARARVKAAEEGLNLARQKKAETILHAPMDGLILSKSAEPGAWLNPGTPVVSLADLKTVWIRAFVSERDLGRVALNAPATVTTDSRPDRAWTGRLSYIASEAEFTPKSVQTQEERVNLMYRVKIEVDNADGALKPGMPADAVIQVKE